MYVTYFFCNYVAHSVITLIRPIYIAVYVLLEACTFISCVFKAMRP